jgi:hypothetical protein
MHIDSVMYLSDPVRHHLVDVIRCQIASTIEGGRTKFDMDIIGT